jgi:hypothetical protein
MKRLLCLVLPAMALTGLIVAARADPVVADPYAITPEAGPWVICAASYVGEDSSNLSHQMAERLRTDYHLAAYIFDRGDAERQKDYEEHLQEEKAWGVHLPFRHPRYTPNCAVLIGGFASLEEANAALLKVKKLDAPLVKLSSGQDARDEEFLIGKKDEQPNRATEMVRVKINPLARSFVVRNPTVPAEKVESPKVDPAWKELNAPESYSLLKNPKAWTLVVKEYAGPTSIQQQTSSSSVMGKLSQPDFKPGEAMAAAGLQAHHLAEFLRDKRIGFDAYVLHTRFSSIVTVGAFDSPDDPELQRTKRRLEALSFKADPRSSGAGTAGGDPIGLFPHPLPMEVPHL